MGNSQSFYRYPREHPTGCDENLHAYYDGNDHKSSGLHSWISFRRPHKLDNAQVEARLAELGLDGLAAANGNARYEKREYLSPSMKREHKKHVDLDTYYSTTKGYPRRLVVQATSAVIQKANAGQDPQACHWSRTHMSGDIPWAIWLTELCLHPFSIDGDKRRGLKHRIRERQGEGCLGNARQEATLWEVAAVYIWKTFRWFLSIVLTLLLGWIIQILISVAIIAAPWTDDDSSEPYARYDNVHWAWPKHAINTLDQSPNNHSRPAKDFRSILPHRLVVRRQNENGETEWRVESINALCERNGGNLEPYMFLSFSRRHFPDHDTNRTLTFRRIANEILDDVNARRMPWEDKINAFWVDFDCVIQTPGKEMVEEVHTICNAVRCAKQVYIMLPDDSNKSKEAWGSRLWTLPEVLLAAEKIHYCIANASQDDKPKIKDVSLTDMSETFWALEGNSKEGIYKPHHERAIAHLVDHYTNRVNLSELQVLAFAIQALAGLFTGSNIGYRTPQLAYAAMGLMSYRLEEDKDDHVFQAIARLCLVNDSDQLLERLLCLLPYTARQAPNAPLRTGEGPVANGIELLLNIADQDQYGCHLWDVRPICDVVGIGNDNIAPTLILDRCRGIPIRWKSFPRLKYAKAFMGFRGTLSQVVLYLGGGFLLYSVHTLSTISVLGFSTLAKEYYYNSTGIPDSNNTYTNNYYGLSSRDVQFSLGVAAIYFGLGWIISWFTPLAVRQLCCGESDVVTSHLIGIEGTVPLKELEEAVFGGTCYGELSYAPSTTPFSAALRDNDLRIGNEPDKDDFAAYWEQQRRDLNIPDTHRLFTIIDTGNLSVSVIAAERPPVVALLCGREGGMLRTLLCSWRFDTNTLFRESVMRMRSAMEDLAKPNDWLKVSLASQGDVGRMRMGSKVPPTVSGADNSSTTLASQKEPRIRASEQE